MDDRVERERERETEREREKEPFDAALQVERNAKANLHSLFDEIERKQRRRERRGNITWQNRARHGALRMEWGSEQSWRMWELSRIKRQPLISDIPKGEIGSAQRRRGAMRRAVNER